MKPASHGQIITFIKTRLTSILRDPLAHGGDLLSAEAQALLLVEVLYEIAGTPERSGGLRDRYRTYLDTAIPGPLGVALPLAHRVALSCRINEFSLILMTFVLQELDTLGETP